MDGRVPLVAPNSQGVRVCRTCATAHSSQADYEQHYLSEHLAVGMVPAASSKGSQVTTVVQPKVEEHYAGEQQEWTDWLGEFEDAVKRGLCDEILRDMARLIFDRRDVMQGKKPGSSFKGLTDAPKSNGEAPVVNVKGGTAQFAADGTFVGKVQPVQSGARGGVEINGKTYLRRDIIGLTIRVPKAATNVPSYVHGLRVAVTGVGEKRAKVTWVDMPKEGSAWRKDADNGKPTFLPLSSLTDILG